jgi:multicomponent Na+:H+ antiporter subunit D
MLYGLALGSADGIGGAIVYTAHHITVQTTLFLACGMLEQRYGTTELTRLGGAIRSAPLLAALWFVPAMSLAGIPPLSGFIGKLGLIRAGTADGGTWAYVAIGAAMVTSLLTLYVVTKVWNLAFWRTAPLPDAAPAPARTEPATPPPLGTGATLVLTKPLKPAPERALPRLTTAATVAAVLLGLAYTFLATPLVGVADRSAAELLSRTPYIEAVLAP